MKKEFINKYRPYPQIKIPERQWPDQRIEKAPLWCSVDLRDGNQALITPMNLSEKIDMFNLLVECGFKEIEVGFPSASEVEFEFLKTLIERKLIPDDVKVQVLTQARKHLIERTFEALDGCRNAILHLYNSTSEQQRRIVFKKNKQEIIDIAIEGVELVKSLAHKTKTNIQLEYSPESFTGTEVEFALEICKAVQQGWGATRDNKIILNLPATVELSTPNIYADMIEWFVGHMKDRESAVISLHTHNDRGTGVAATELGLMAGADRVEGTLFGNGERTGNVDLITVALNMFTQGVDPKLNLSHMDTIIQISEQCTKIPVHMRHPYAGSLVFTAFSGSHQDAINKGMQYAADKKSTVWDVPYLPIDPSDLGKTYEAIIRINSQSGKGGVAYVLESEYGCTLPKAMHPEFARVIQSIADKTGEEVESDIIWRSFRKEYLDVNKPLEFRHFKSLSQENSDAVECRVTFLRNGTEQVFAGEGNGPIDACKHAIEEALNTKFQILSYHEHSLSQGSGSEAIAYIQVTQNGKSSLFGVGIDTNINLASIKALFSAVNRLFNSSKT